MGFLSSLGYSVAIFGLVLVASVGVAAIKNITITVPDGSSNHGDPNLLCTLSSWTDVITFYVGNYVAHAATVISLPGESTISTIRVGLSALLFPTSGLMRGFLTIATFATFAKTDLQKAARSRALCMVIRSQDWKPRVGDVVSDAILASPSVKPLGKNTTDRNAGATLVRVFESPWATLKTDEDTTASINPDFVIHGSIKLPDGYELAYVSGDVDFEDDWSPPNSTKISCRYNLVGGLVSLAQAIYASITLYQSSGDQIATYGYAAFGLTVAPFVMMSIINLVGNLLAPSYPALYLVDSSVMTEARKRDGCHIDGVVGKLKEASVADLGSQDDKIIWIQSVSFDYTNSNGQLSVQFESPLGSTFHGSLAQETALLVMEEDAVELSNLAEEQVQIEEQEHAHLVLQETIQNRASDDDGSRCVLYIPSCPQVSPSPTSKKSGWMFVVGWLISMAIFSAFDFLRRWWRRAFPTNASDERGGGTEGETGPVKGWNLLGPELLQYRNQINSIAYTVSKTPGSHSYVRVSSSRPNNPPFGASLTLLFGILVSIGGPVAIVGGLSHFQLGSSTTAQRAWTMAWLSSSTVGGFFASQAHRPTDKMTIKEGYQGYGLVGLFLIFGVPAIGGLVVVGQMIREYGTCIQIP